MRLFNRFTTIITFIILTGFFISGCNLMSLLYPEPTPTAIPSPTPEPITEVSICLGSEPRSLYVYEAASSSERIVTQALSDGPIDVTNGGEKIAVLLTSLPTVDDGSVVNNAVDVAAGDIVANTAGNLVSLEAGVEVFPAGCTSLDCALVWDGATSLQVNQLIVQFTLKDGLLWSDGEALTADDFVYSFDIAADPSTPVSKHLIDLTQLYQAIDDVTIEWTAVPGFVTDGYEDFLWPPLPNHVWNGASASTLLDDETANHKPLSYGPFMVDEWQAGQSIRMVKNPNYHRASEGLPAADILTFKFLSAADSASLLTAAQAECDIVAPAAIGLQDIQYLSQNASGFGIELKSLPSQTVEILGIGMTPSSYDDNYYPYGSDRPDFFGDVRTRQALAYCIDQNTITEKLLAGGAEPANGLLPANDPLMSGLTSPEIEYDPAAGIALLQQVGWQDVDLNPDTPLTAFSIANIPFGIPFEIELLTSSSPLRGEIAAEIATNLSACGIRANVTQLPLSELYQPAPEGPLFGRNFDLALISMQIAGGFDCRWFSSDEIPSENNYWLGTATGGANFFGYQNADFDAQCSLVQRSGVNVAEKMSALQAALSQVNNDLPVIPIYHHPSVMLVRDTICGFEPNDSQSDLFKAIENIGFGDGC